MMMNIQQPISKQSKLSSAHRNDSISDISLSSQNSSLSFPSSTKSENKAKTKSNSSAKHSQGDVEDSNRISNGVTTYQMGAEIGRGGFAIVYSAFNVETGDFVAVKRFPLDAIDDDSLNKIQDEIELMKQLNHPNIVKYINTIKTKSYLHIVLEYMENGSLSTVIKKYGSISEPLTASYVTQVLQGLKYLHEQGVLHRDIKGANILTTKEGTVKLADFGVAMKLSEAHADDQDVVGSPYWIAPEIIEMSTPTAACDIWSVGCIIIELLTGKPPYYDLAPMAALFRIVQDDYPPFPEGISQALRDFLLLCFQKEPVMRSSASKLLGHPWLSNVSKSASMTSARRQAQDDDSGITPNASSSHSASTVRSRSSNFKSSSSSSAVAASLSTSSELATVLSKSNSKSSSPRKVRSSGHNRSSTGKKRDAFADFHDLSALSEKDGFESSSTRTQIDQNSTNFTTETNSTVDPFRIDLIYAAEDPQSLLSPQLTFNGDIRKVPFSRQSSPALSDSTADTKDMMLPTPTPIQSYTGVDSQLRFSGGRSSLSTPTNVPNFSLKANSQDQRISKKTFQSKSSDGTEGGINAIADPSRDGSGDDSINSEKWDDEFDTFDDKSITLSLDETTATPLSNNPPVSRNNLVPRFSISTSEKITSGDLSQSDISQQYSNPMSPKSQFRSQSLDSLAKTVSNSNLVANQNVIVDAKKASLMRSITRDSIESISSNRAFLNVNNSSFLLSKFQETKDDNNFDDVFGRDNNKGRQKILSGLSKSSDYSYKQKDERALRSMSSDCYEPPSRNRTVRREKPEKPSAIKISVGSISQNRNDKSKTDFSALNNRWKGAEQEPQQQQHHQQHQQHNHNHATSTNQNILLNRHPFNRLGMISEDKDAAEYDFNDDFEIDQSIDFNEKLERYRNNAVQGSSSSGSQQGSSSRDTSMGQGIYDSKRFGTSFSTNSVADIDDDTLEEYESDEYNDGEKFAGQLRQRMQLNRKDASGQEFDVFNNYQFFDEKDFKQDESKDEHFRRSREVVEIMEKIRPETMEETVIELCDKLMELFTKYPDQRDHLITYHGVMPIIDMFEARTSAETKSQGGKILRPYVLRVINKIIEGSTRAQEQISLVGLIPTIMNLFEKSCRSQLPPQQQPLSTSNQIPHSIFSSNSAEKANSKGFAESLDAISNKTTTALLQSPYAQWQGEVNPVAIEAARFIHQISSTSQLTLQMLIGAGGLSVLTTMVSFGAYIVPRSTLSATHSLSHSRSSSHSQLHSNSQSPQNFTPPPTAMSTTAVSNRTFSQSLMSDSGIASSARANLFNNINSNSLATASQVSSRSPTIRYDSRFIGSFSPSGTIDFDLNTSSNESGIDVSRRRSIGLAIAQSQVSAANVGDPKNCMDIFRMGIDCITQVFSVQSSRTRDFCRLFVKLGLLQHLSVSFQNILYLYLDLIQKRHHTRSCSGSLAVEASAASAAVPGLPSMNSSYSISSQFDSNDDSTERVYAKSVATLFFKFSRSDAVVAQLMANSEAGVIGVILETLSAPELRQFSSPNVGQFPLSPLQQFRDAYSNLGTAEPSTSSRRKASLGGLHPSYLEIVELLLKCCKNLSMEPSILNELDKAGIIETLIPLLQGPISELCKNHVLPCLFNMCRINKRRQDKAALLGIIPHLKKVVADRSHLKQFALPIIFDLAHASSASRAELWKNDGVSFYLDQLKENYWHTSALNSLSMWLTKDLSSVSRLLVEPAKLSKLIDFFRSSNATVHKNLKPIVDMMAKSTELCRSLGSSSVFVTALSKRLTATKDAFVSRSLLRMLTSVINSLPDPKLWIAEHNLYHVLNEVSQTEGQILVNSTAKTLLQNFQSLQS